ncbi:AAA family ATPase [Legionella spiritensis]|uniref:ATPase n=1 Tax=Legionella spiritensis TaxID=452 RepID=A0A0W0YZ21_LEGSP|nr:AAA family ATPase [Legionella spiritensis]KTD62165.1 ATPase [Legionella spiritensis]SNV29454.1 ATPase [Legionella spiritensis]
MNKHNYFILTGAMGAGKSTILKELRKLGFLCIDEPARQILAEQRAIEGSGVPEHDPKLFADLLLSRSIYQFKQMENRQGPVIYDRGIPDNIGYAKLFDLDCHSQTKAAHQYQYNKQVLFLPAWEEIYENDDERKMTYSQAKLFGDDVRKIYEDLSYNIIEVPLLPPYERAEFIVNTIVKKMAAQSAMPLETAPDCQNILQELKQREPIFHRREFGTSREALENMTTASFWEIGASGRRYCREYVIKTLLERYQQQPIDDWETEQWGATDFCCQKIADHNYLLTYTLTQGTRITRRSTIWRLENDSWKIAYHQGTVVEDTL